MVLEGDAECLLLLQISCCVASAWKTILGRTEQWVDGIARPFPILFNGGTATGTGYYISGSEHIALIAVLICCTGILTENSISGVLGLRRARRIRHMQLLYDI
jgi:hypothetical protein